jgi:hypothetical protein
MPKLQLRAALGAVKLHAWFCLRDVEQHPACHTSTSKGEAWIVLGGAFRRPRVPLSQVLKSARTALSAVVSAAAAATKSLGLDGQRCRGRSDIMFGGVSTCKVWGSVDGKLWNRTWAMRGVDNRKGIPEARFRPTGQMPSKRSQAIQGSEAKARGCTLRPPFGAHSRKSNPLFQIPSCTTQL